MLKAYYYLTKPGIIYGNLLTAAAGFLLASKGNVAFGLMLAALAGTALVIASACVFNNYIDRGIDAKMVRTKKRAIVSGKISGRNALIYGAVLGIIGFTLLALFTNTLTVIIGLVAIFSYVVVYGFFKRRSTLGTVVGSIPGATPPVAGYTAVTGQLDSGAVLLFLILVLWQMPHFYAIAMFRFKDYKAAGLPVLPVKRGMSLTKIYILLYIAAFTAVAAMLTVYEYTGYVYLVSMVALGITWFSLGLTGFQTPDDRQWARTMFMFSLIVLLSFSVLLCMQAIFAM